MFDSVLLKFLSSWKTWVLNVVGGPKRVAMHVAVTTNGSRGTSEHVPLPSWMMLLLLCLFALMKFLFKLENSGVMSGAFNSFNQHTFGLHGWFTCSISAARCIH
ncbi:hypothetical protein POM88_013096 [Heracleum sosnowskyi]|uniref:Uncharacterized protein n=1 Tax=Heracleum sosnowskyi TaxID=360622 RepID=A0AAD8IXY2_9APIA|nr:hypothetical protein POM88_013096 [Heracleum sosnowskyi]